MKHRECLKSFLIHLQYARQSIKHNVSNALKWRPLRPNKQKHSRCDTSYNNFNGKEKTMAMNPILSQLQTISHCGCIIIYTGLPISQQLIFPDNIYNN